MLDRKSRRPLSRQIYDLVRNAILNADLPSQSKLPSTRALAKRLGVSRNTVSNAYEELSFEGLIAGRAGSGTYVGAKPPRNTSPPKPSLSFRRILREAHYATQSFGLCDPDGNPIRVYER